MNLKSKLISLGLVKGSGPLLLLLNSLLIAEHFGLEEAGIISIILTLTTAVSVISKLGIDIWVTSLNAGQHKKSDFTNAALITFLLGTITSFICHEASNAISKQIDGNEETTQAIQIFSLAIAPMNTLSVLASILRIQSRDVTASILQMSVLPLCFFALTATIVFRPNPSIYALSIGYISSAYIAFFLTFIASLKHLEFPRLINTIKAFLSVLANAMPMTLAPAVSFLLSWSDTLIVGYLCNKEETAIISMAGRVGAITSLGLLAVNYYYGPRIAGAYRTKNHSSFETLKSEATKYTFNSSLIMLVVVCGALFALSTSTKSGEYLIVPGITIAASYLINAAFGPAGTTLLLTGASKLHNLMSACCLLTNIILNLILAPKYGAIGASIGTATAISLQGILSNLFLKQYLDRNKLHWSTYDSPKAGT